MKKRPPDAITLKKDETSQICLFFISPQLRKQSLQKTLTYTKTLPDKLHNCICRPQVYFGPQIQ